MPTRHEELFERYTEDLAEAKVVAEAWWEALLAAEESRLGDRESAISSVKKRWPVGPASHPRVIAVVREGFLKCHALNDEIEAQESAPAARTKKDREEEEEAEEPVDPYVFASEWLLESPTEELADFISVLTYWPIGLDEDFDPI